jgi:hypothetical protein
MTQKMQALLQVGVRSFTQGDKARAIFAQSGLRENMLAHIWTLSDIQKRGKLNSDEFAVAMYLIYQKLNGQDLPAQLPQNLVPPSQRNLSELSDFAKLDALKQQPVRRISPSSSLVGLSAPILNIQKQNTINPELMDLKRKELIAHLETKRIEVSAAKEEIGLSHGDNFRLIK